MKRMKDSVSASNSSRFIADHIAALPKSGIRAFFDLANSMEGVISLGVGEPDFVTPWRFREGGIFSIERGHTSYTSNLGMPSLRREICRYVSSEYNIEYSPEKECLVTVGVSEAVDLAMRAILNPGDEVIYAEPSYVSYPAEIRMAYGVPVPVQTKVENNFALDPADIAANITPRTKAILLNCPCNPTGADIPLDKLQGIADMAIKHDLLVLADEIYSELFYEGEHISIASLPGMYERTIFLHGFSKAFAMTGWRIGYACGPAPIIDAMMKIHQYAIMCAPTMAQEAALEALLHGESDVRRMRDSYHERRDFFVEGLNRLGLKCIMPQGAFYAFPSIKSTGLTSTEFAEQLLQKERVAVVPGPAFGAGGEGFVRCCYATARKDLEEALARMERFLASL
jgi:aminotransferase